MAGARTIKTLTLDNVTTMGGMDVGRRDIPGGLRKVMKALDQLEFGVVAQNLAEVEGIAGIGVGSAARHSRASELDDRRVRLRRNSCIYGSKETIAALKAGEADKAAQ